MYKMNNGDFIRKKKAFLIEKFTTQEGLFSFFIGTAVWYFLIVKYIIHANESFFNYFNKIIPIDFLAQYITYLSLGVVFSIIGMGITIILVYMFKQIKKIIK